MSGSSLAIGIDIGGTRAKAALLDDAGNVRQWQLMPTRSLSDGGSDAVAALCRKLCDAADVSVDSLAGVGLAVPGPVDPRTGQVAACVNLPGWSGDPAGSLASRLGRPAYLENDANAAAFGEYHHLHRADPALRDAVTIMVGTGIGGGIVCDGRLLRGMGGVAGELGHVVIEPGGRACPCGQRGCLERYASATAIAMRYRELRGEAGGGNGADAGGDDADAEAVIAAAAGGDAAARAAVEESIHYLALGCLALARIVDPAVIIVGGGVANAGDAWLSRLQARFDELQWSLPTTRPELRRSELGDRAGAVGAGLLALDRVGDGRSTAPAAVV